MRISTKPRGVVFWCSGQRSRCLYMTEKDNWIRHAHAASSGALFPDMHTASNANETGKTIHKHAYAIGTYINTGKMRHPNTFGATIANRNRHWHRT